MIAKTTPLARLPSAIDVFDYLVPKELEEKVKPGQLITVPWRSKKAEAVILFLSTKQESTKFRARPITNILYSDPVLTTSQLALIKQFSDYYFVTKGLVARLITPNAPHKRVTLKPYITNSTTEFSIAKNRLEILKECASLLVQSTHYVHMQDVSSFVWLIMHISKKYNSQVLVLVPTIDMIDALYRTVQKMCSDTCVLIHSGINKTQYWNAYNNIKNNIAKIIFSTRQGVFLPIQQNSTIIFFEHTSNDFKQYDQHPKYDSRIVGTWVQKITKSKIIYCSSSRILTTQNITYIDLACASNYKIKTQMVDMKQEMQRKDFNIIGYQTMEKIQQTLQKKQKLVIVSLREKSEKGTSVEAIYELLTKLLKNCNISLNTNEFDVLVTTPYTLEGLKLSSERGELETVIFASIEPLLAIPDYRSQERAYHKLEYWKLLCQELGFSNFILQSYSPESEMIKAFAYGEVNNFLLRELSHRKELEYPPFVKLVKLSYRGKKNISTEDDDTAKTLKQNLDSSVKILGPFVDKKEKLSILLKITKPTNLSVLKNLVNNWSIDRDPDSTI